MPTGRPEKKEKRTFSFTQAAALLGEIQQLTEAAYRKVATLARALPPDEDARRDAQAKADEIVKGWAREVMDHGVEVKGLWLVDFDNGSGYYCWQYPEPSLQYFHSYEEGFRGRMRIQ